MKKLLILTAVAALVISGVAWAAPSSKPQRVMSLNLCTDQLVLQLLPRERITSVSYLSQSWEHSYLTADALGVRINFGTSEEVLKEQPDLVLAGSASTPTVRALLKRVGVPLVEVPAAESFAEIRTVTRQVARAVGEEEMGEILLAQMDATLDQLGASSPRQRIVVAAWDGAGSIPAKGTLFDEILTVAGAHNIAADISTTLIYGRYASVDLEQLVALKPDILAYGSSRIGRMDLSNEKLQHRVIRKLYRGREITYPETLYGCGLPQSATAAAELRRTILDVMKRAP